MLGFPRQIPLNHCGRGLSKDNLFGKRKMTGSIPARYVDVWMHSS